ncbi:helix-turn-helix domain-containing protein [Bradyrhizobium zhanjiangense]|uniref:helix-turn-helix domain-containing protein n=1 Tax=Bradyrhizobium zhanjiangense TaxID=1325107 RepID=UPI001008EDAC|nr:helix-turn-helix domain-containing protein [Bradyrhizobium zhanjiangense]
MIMQVHFSTDHIAPRDRVKFWCDYFAKQAHSITPGEIPDPAAFRAEASGSIAGEFALLEISSGLERVQRTAADVARDKIEAFFVSRFRAPVIWRAAARSTPVDLIHEPGDFCISSTEWQFNAEWKGPESFDMLIIPWAALSPIIAGGRLERPFRLAGASPLGSLLGAAIDAVKAQAPLLSNEHGEAVLRNLCGLVALSCNISNEGINRGRDSLQSARLAAAKRYVDLHLADPSLTAASAAAALDISARQLHRLFEANNVSFARYVSRERLLRCRDAIADATGTGRSVIDIAFGWGFNSMATFYRTFASEFGSPPTMLRAASQGRVNGQRTTGKDTS